jgi:hypothetical protein
MAPARLAARSDTPRVIGILADLQYVSALFETQDCLQAEWDEAMDDPTPTEADGAPAALEELDVALNDAEQTFQEALGRLLKRGMLTRALAAAVDQGVLPVERALQLRAEALWLATHAIVMDTDALADTECTLVAVPIAPLAAPLAGLVRTAFLESLRTTLIDATGHVPHPHHPPLAIAGTPAPLHPLAWAESTVETRLALFEELQARAPGEAWAQVWAAHERLVGDDTSAPPTERPSDGVVPTAQWLWPVVVFNTLAEDDERFLDEALYRSRTAPAWAAWQNRAARTWGLTVAAPLGVEEAVAHTLRTHVQAHLDEAFRTMAMPADAAARTVLVGIEPGTDPASRVLVFEHPQVEVPDLSVPALWMGSHPSLQDDTEAALYSDWGWDDRAGHRAQTFPQVSGKATQEACPHEAL